MKTMTSGSAYRHLWRYALPLILGNWLQLAYNAADSVIAGRFLGAQALAAEGAAAPVMNLVILGISGVTVGAGVLMSEFFGAGKQGLLRRTLATTLAAGAIFSVLVAGAGWAAAPALLRALAVPPELFVITVRYLRITFLGVPFTCFYNALAAGLKSVGDSKNPLRFLAFSALLNILLDLFFLGVLGFGIACSATTTVAAEAVSAVLAACYLRRLPSLCPQREEWKIDRALLARTMRYGGVTALQQLCQPIGKVLIQGQVNALGVEVMAAFNAVTRFDDFACIPEQSIAQGITTFLAQNRGAGKRQRLRGGFGAGLVMELGYGVAVGGVTALLRRPLVALFVTGESAETVVALGAEYLGVMAALYLLPALTNGFQGFYRGMGRMQVTLLGTLVQISLRVAGTAALAPRAGLTGIAWACGIGWCAMLCFEIPYYFHFWRKRREK